jgi:hypothetical protein
MAPTVPSYFCIARVIAFSSHQELRGYRIGNENSITKFPQSTMATTNTTIEKSVEALFWEKLEEAVDVREVWDPLDEDNELQNMMKDNKSLFSSKDPRTGFSIAEYLFNLEGPDPTIFDFLNVVLKAGVPITPACYEKCSESKRRSRVYAVLIPFRMFSLGSQN